MQDRRDHGRNGPTTSRCSKKNPLKDIDSPVEELVVPPVAPEAAVWAPETAFVAAEAAVLAIEFAPAMAELTPAVAPAMAELAPAVAPAEAGQL